MSTPAPILRRFNNIVYQYASVTSTNDVARELAESGAGEGTTVVAEEQTTGRGRLGRTWLSPKGEGLYHSIILRPDILPSNAPVLGLVVAVALAEFVRERYQLATDIKWPNDVLIRDRKVAGILAEAETSPNGIRYIMAGIGINLNQTSFPPEVAAQATSIKLETGQTSDPDEVRQKLYVKLDAWYDRFLGQGAAEVIRRWSELSSYAEGKAVKVITGDRTISGITRGLTPTGALIVEPPTGEWEAILTGEVQRLRKE
ncbi:MAG: biotin--[acetyl-CoA-carboxylase] ligase [Acidobacteria bacterium]|nr:biotin--[acetyl-CoA-carboxylase] ligase [Acidobacteriota bacterium]